MATNPSTKRKIALGLSALAVIGMGSITVACSPRSEEPAETTVPTPATPTEKHVRNHDPGGGGGNPAVPCGYGPGGGAGCSNKHPEVPGMH